MTHDVAIHERCAECGFDGDTWADDAALAALVKLPDRWSAAIDGIAAADLVRRPWPDRWSIAEYTDHVRETLFGMRFVLDVAVFDPGTDLGEPPTPLFDSQPRRIDINVALATFRREVELLVERLRALDEDQWSLTAIIGRDTVDAHWVVRHAIHDVTHHLDDITTLRDLL